MDRTFDSVRKAYDQFMRTDYQQEGTNGDAIFLIRMIEQTRCALLMGTFVDPNAKKQDIHTKVYPAFIFGETLEVCLKNALIKCSNMFNKKDGCISYRVYISAKSLAEIENPQEIDWSNEYTLTKEIVLTKLSKKN